MSAPVPPSVRHAYRLAVSRARRSAAPIWRADVDTERAIVRMYATGGTSYTDADGTSWGRDGCYKGGPRPWEGLPRVDQTGALQW